MALNAAKSPRKYLPLANLALVQRRLCSAHRSSMASSKAGEGVGVVVVVVVVVGGWDGVGVGVAGGGGLHVHGAGQQAGPACQQSTRCCHSVGTLALC